MRRYDDNDTWVVRFTVHGSRFSVVNPKQPILKMLPESDQAMSLHPMGVSHNILDRIKTM